MELLCKGFWTGGKGGVSMQKPRILILEGVLLLTLCAQAVGWGYERSTDTKTVYYAPQRVLTVTTILIEPYVMLKWVNSSAPKNIADVQGMYEGFIVDLMTELASIVGFRFRLIQVYEGQFGYKKPDGSWDGVIGEIMRKEADIAAGPVFITSQREKVVDFTRPFLKVTPTVLIRKQHQADISTLEDIVSQPYYEYGTLNRGIIRRGFRLSNNTLFRNMWRYMQAHEEEMLTKTNEEGIRRVRAKKYAFILPNTIADYISRRKPCDIQMVPIVAPEMQWGYGLAVRKGSGLRDYLNSALLILEERGFLQSLYEKWWINRGSCAGIRSSRVVSSYSSGSSHLQTVLVSTVLTLIVIFSECINVDLS